MSVDDQLFKQDGTYLTKVDVVILRTARCIATTMFAEAEDETYGRALKRILKLAGILAVTGGVVKGLGGDSFSLYVFALLGTIYYLSAGFHTCNGRGTSISRGEKAMYLLFLSVPFLLGIVTMGLILTSQVSELSRLGYVIWCVGYFLAMLGPHYVARLGAKPPKRKKVKALRPAMVKT